ncbi:hypothetical protein ACIQBJ_25750 [Kitasatospora sp. NPDC088391]
MRNRKGGADRPEARGTAALVRATRALTLSTWCLAVVTAAELLVR